MFDDAASASHSRRHALVVLDADGAR